MAHILSERGDLANRTQLPSHLSSPPCPTPCLAVSGIWCALWLVLNSLATSILLSQPRLWARNTTCLWLLVQQMVPEAPF